MISAVMLLLLGSWWLYLVLKLATKLNELNYPSIEGNLIKMIQWEGVTFFILLVFLIVTLLVVYISDLKKTKSLQAFFSSLTHELKTPLASIKLQTQVLSDFIEDLNLSEEQNAKIQKYTTRLTDDSLRLEDQLDNHLQLSRIERGSFVNLRNINISNFLSQEIKRYNSLINIEINIADKTTLIKADDFALQTIFRNLIENSIRHVNKDIKEAKIHVVQEKNKVKVFYTDNGEGFNGDTQKLGQLFYKHNSPKGSGLGLYIIKKLMYVMNGKPNIRVEDKFIFELHFQPGDKKNEN